MQKNSILILIVLLLFVLFTSCTVNSSTGLLTITNSTNYDITSIKIGNITLDSYLPQGQTYNFWYYSILSGQLTGGSVVNDVIYYLSGREGDTMVSYGGSQIKEIDFKVDYQYKIDIIEENSQNYFCIHGGLKPGDNTLDNVDNPIQ